MKYEAILFDMDGVILDSEPLHAAAFRATLADYGHYLSQEEYKEHFAGKTDEAGFDSYFEYLGQTVDFPAVMDEKAKKYLELAADQLVPYPGVVDLIRNLAHDIPLALVTGSLRLEAETALKLFKIIDCFKIIVAAEDITSSKPDPEGYLKASESLGVSRAQCVVIEDSPNGVQAALAAHMECIAVTTTHSAEELRAATKIVRQLDLSVFVS